MKVRLFEAAQIGSEMTLTLPPRGGDVGLALHDLGVVVTHGGKWTLVPWVNVRDVTGDGDGPKPRPAGKAPGRPRA